MDTSPIVEPVSSVIENKHETILILDFGSQYSHLIARRVREANVFCELISGTSPIELIRSHHPKGIILSGGPASVYEAASPHVHSDVWSLGIPILGICYGVQEMAHQLGGEVQGASEREFGHSTLLIDVPHCDLFAGLPATSRMWMSHGDKLTKIPTGFENLAHTENCPHAALWHPQKRFYGLQFHPEVTHSDNGTLIVSNFVRRICGCKGDWTMNNFVTEACQTVNNMVRPDEIVIGAVSGGVDSTVAAALLHRAIGSRFKAVFVDNGLLRKNEVKDVTDRFMRLGVDLLTIDASEKFLSGLKGVTEPETKRKIIGKTFIDVFEEHAKNISGANYLLQGTLYPDVIESTSFKGPSTTIKTHHNVGGLPDVMRMKLIEPLRLLFKDEVRALGEALGLEHEAVWRHPFPGPGLSIRVLGEVTKERLDILREADEIFITELRQHKLYETLGQAFVVLLPVKTVGVMGDSRTYDSVAAIRAVESTDFMTADWAALPYEFLRRVSTRIVNEVRGINRVTYDITSKPPGTIEWE
eukprot:TRINITY_DN12238_c0_g1::TRINITY_DN12238_c0_g1_i1::g.12984::m.12984 TRINITY_DN12238_c0_g1::TRINITY_DN12238_c0_g1_i1::g.12984  ORF type:complete len:549 (+),score=153.22,sp/Q756B7/GUAA_ASHGO/59.28/0.0,GMP_synt_C/PF00958.17/8.4e-40,GATase/PF00117.23/2.2e-36,Peptidase_C26/PF07722.8/4.7e-06,NAD_synthase/PF02540.12/4.6e-05,NAD_synthase/PF02540.12/2.8e+02,Asn_synthase/PF00733.16/2.9e+03,Asn_synthase/PF00733.16/0.0017,tRNA_Me_trans/PF03054.11/0.0041,Arginosuc_synth/PF00764.14/0.015,QueC/PF06508.8/0.35,Qu